MPLMVTPRVEIALVNTPTHKALVDYVLYVHFFGLEHIVEGVAVLLQPKFIDSLNIFSRKLEGSKRIVLRCVNNNVGIFEPCNWAGSRCQISCEPVIPTSESISWMILVTNVIVVIDKSHNLFTE